MVVKGFTPIYNMIDFEKTATYIHRYSIYVIVFSSVHRMLWSLLQIYMYIYLCY